MTNDQPPMTSAFHAALRAFAVGLVATFALPVGFGPEDQLKAPVATLPLFDASGVDVAGDE